LLRGRQPGQVDVKPLSGRPNNQLAVRKLSNVTLATGDILPGFGFALSGDG
jgi:hypothetical protein